MKPVQARDEHFEEIRSWLSGYGIDPLPREFFPPTTFVVPGIAAVSLYLTDSSMAYLERLIGNPGIDKQLRDRGLDIVMDHAADVAAEAGARLLVSTTQAPAVTARFERHGFGVHGQGFSVLTASLQKRSP